MTDLDAIAVFDRVVERKSFAEAARSLGLTTSAVSKRIARLERALGATLLHRTTRRLSLTEAGAVYHDRIRRVLGELASAEEAVTRLGTEPHGLLRVSAPMSFGHLHLAPLVPEFLAAHPGLRVDLELDDRLVDLIDGGFDVAVRIAALADSSLVARRLAPARRVICGSPDYLARRGVPRHPADLARHDCLRYTLQARGDWTVRRGRSGARVEVSGSLQANNGEVLRAAALAGLGLVFLPTMIVWRDLQAGTLVPVLVPHLPPPTAIHAVYPRSRLLSPKVRAFVDFLAARFGPRPPWDRACEAALRG
jgi:DNA-binding transcriptional LysR family regulator